MLYVFKYRQAFNPEVFRNEAEKMKRKKLARYRNAAALKPELRFQPLISADLR